MIDKLKVIHIHTDYKFIIGSETFKGKYFENSIIIIERDKPYSGPFIENSTFFKNTKHDINQIIKICKDADLVVFYGLELIKTKIALRLPKNVKIAWRFFGYELYAKKRNVYLSEKTKQAIKTDYHKTPFKILKVFFRKIKTYFSLFIFSGSPSILFHRANLRINFFLALSNEEYNHLTSYWKLPAFIKLPIRSNNCNKDVLRSILPFKQMDKLPIIIVGNSKNEFNNHFDLIDLIEQNINKKKYNFTLLFNYGSEKKYTTVVRQKVIGKKYFKTIEDFMPIENFKLLYKKTSALVINSYRQMAGANVFEGFQNGVKIYLNEKNVMLQWFKNEGFYIFTIEDFEDDLKNNNIFLTQEEANHNLQQLINCSKKYTIDDFQKILYNQIKSI